ncbi:MAG: UDP-2,3-diacylglucosamine diphosphatase [Prevotellaceae bacterium]|jgi:UDP-2,3-diacylglucosamine hydrolase|nr:UDP-2,3-diacylglucosamine diphosphatase [Prevotellaceae bacterium]
MSGKKIYFASDVHLGLKTYNSAREREIRFVRWLEIVRHNAEAIFLLGDIFDFWFEYKKVVPKGFVRTLGKIAEITDSGIPVHYFTGNHDLWAFNYFPEETGVILHTQAYKTELKGKYFFLAHGDGLDVTDKGYRQLKAIFTNRFLQRCFAAIHPRIGVGFGHVWSQHSRLSKGVSIGFKGEEEGIYKFAKQQLNKESVIDYFVFGHRHTPLIINVNNTNTKLVILGEWIEGCQYAVFDGKNIELLKFD